MTSCALITGATSGIGAAFARRLAAGGADLVLVARDEQRLATTKAELLGRYDVSVETISADLATREGLDATMARLHDLDKPVDLLVNNAGFGLKGTFTGVEAADHRKMIDVNISAVVELSHAALRTMEQIGRGGILNVASVAAFAPGFRPSATYAATKAFVIAFTEGLAASLRAPAVHVMALCPGFVRSEFHQRAGISMSSLPSWLWLEPDAVAAAALEDFRRNKVISVPGAQYKVLAAFMKHLPRAVIRRGSRHFGKH